MSDQSRIIAGPPSRPSSGGGAGSLLRANRTAQQQSEPPTDQSRAVAPPPPAPRRAVQQTIASAPEPEVEADPVLTVEPTDTPAVSFREPDQPASAPTSTAPVLPEQAPETASQQHVPPVAAEPSTPYTRRRYGDSGATHPDDIVKVTFEIRRGDRDAFNNAFPVAALNEGYRTPKDVLVDLYLGETKRLQDQYNGGQPFPERSKQAPRGRPIRRDT